MSLKKGRSKQLINRSTTVANLQRITSSSDAEETTAFVHHEVEKLLKHKFGADKANELKDGDFFIELCKIFDTGQRKVQIFEEYLSTYTTDN